MAKAKKRYHVYVPQKSVRVYKVWATSPKRALVEAILYGDDADPSDEDHEEYSDGDLEDYFDDGVDVYEDDPQYGYAGMPAKEPVRTFTEKECDYALAEEAERQKTLETVQQVKKESAEQAKAKRSVVPPTD